MSSGSPWAVDEPTDPIDFSVQYKRQKLEYLKYIGEMMK